MFLLFKKQKGRLLVKMDKLDYIKKTFKSSTGTVDNTARTAKPMRTK